ncbi:MAG: hypothetical protein AB4050_03500 [Synechococcus sp.]
MADGIDKAGADRAAQASAEVQSETARVIALAIATAIAQLKRTGEAQSVRDSLTVEGEERMPLVKIKVGGRNVFVGRPREEPQKNLVTEDILEKIRTAIDRPEDYKGIFSIQVGGEVVYRVQNGEVKLQTVSQEELQQAVAAVFEDFDRDQENQLDTAEVQQADKDRANEASIEGSESREEVAPSQSAEDISQSLQQELVDLRQRMLIYEERLNKLEELVDSGQLVPVSEAASQALTRVERSENIAPVNELFNGVTKTAKDAVRLAGTQVQEKREQLVERFARNVMRPMKLAESATKTKLASMALNTVGHRAFARAATADVLQKAALIAHVQGDSQNGARVWTGEQYEVRYDQSGLVVRDREGDRGEILATEGRSVKQNRLQLRDVALIGDAGIGATQVLAAARRAHAAINGDREHPKGQNLLSTGGR